jgi:hypothetical protein
MSRPLASPGPVATVAVASALWLLHAAAAWAHDGSTSVSRLVVDGADVQVSLTLNLLDLHGGPLVDSDGDEFISDDEIDERIDAVFEAVKSHYRLRAPDVPAALMLERYALVDDSTLTMDIHYRFARNVTSIHVASTLPDITQVNHHHLVRIDHGGPRQMALLDRGQPAATLRAGSGTVGWRTTRSESRTTKRLMAVSLLITTCGLPWAVRRVLFRACARPGISDNERRGPR